MSDSLHWLIEYPGTIQGYGRASVTVASAEVATNFLSVPQTDEARSGDIDAFGRLLAAADMADLGVGSTDITDLSDDEYLRHLIG